ncbi:hypothetical protein V1525DRAFT_337370 [Lipomyces kononenkoae]|uniref:Uncharacterized protein n=1 Tax=Lipomyces kononenkoae TaxID=34357 RepID=A0ACC3T8M6_LIPKO
MAYTSATPGSDRLTRSRAKALSNSQEKVAANGVTSPKKDELPLSPVQNGVNGKKAKKSQEALTPRSRSPLGLIPSHKRYRYFIHKYEVPRKLLHVSIGFLTLGLYWSGIKLSEVTPVLVFLLVSIVILDALRFKSQTFSAYYIKAFGFLMRESEVNKWNGIVWYLLGLILVFLFFPKDISILSILLLSWCDTAASSFGRAYGHLTPKFFRNKSLAGTAAAFLTGVFAAYLEYGLILPATPVVNIGEHLTWTPETSKLSLSVLCILSGFVGAAAEAVDLWGLDDNITIPVISAIVMQFTVVLFEK